MSTPTLRSNIIFRLFGLFFIILCSSHAIQAKPYSARQLIIQNSTTLPLGRSGTGVASPGIDVWSLNPSSIARLDQLSLSMSYGTISHNEKHYYPSITFSIPTDIGVWGTALYFVNVPHSLDFNKAYGLNIGLAKDATDHLFLGISCNILYSNLSDKSFFSGLSLGFQYLFTSTQLSKGFGLIKPRIGFSLTVGFPFTTADNAYNLNQISAGYSFSFFKNYFLEISFYNDISVLYYREFPIKFGIEFEIVSMFFIRGGYSYPYKYNNGDYSIGLGFKQSNSVFSGSLQYALNHLQKNGFTHYLGLTIEIGRIDNHPPVTNIIIENKYFSPNHDGIQDFVIFNISIVDESTIAGWKIHITDSSNQLVKEYSLIDNEFQHSFSIRKIISRLFKKRAKLIIPELLIWDGTDLRGKKLNDGKYQYSFIAWDSNENISVNKSGSIILDTTPPEISLKIFDDIFSPNGDGKKDYFHIQQTAKSSSEDRWRAQFRNTEGSIVKSYQWDGDKIPVNLLWDGKNDSGADLPDGIYHYLVTCIDKAGNAAQAEIHDITLSRQNQYVDILISSRYYSLNENKPIKLFPRLSSINGLLNWRIEIINNQKKLVRSFIGESQVPKFIDWNGSDDSGKPLPDGNYSIKLLTTYDSGNTPESYSKIFTIDSSPPIVSISHQPTLFSPDNNSEDDILIIKPSIQDPYGIREWTIKIISSSEELFKFYSGKGIVPGEILWDGRGDNGDIVESASDYQMYIEATDNAGNHSKSKTDIINIDVLVLVTERGLKIRISNIEFPIGSEDIKGKGKSVLLRVTELLNKYNQYDVIIEGHTDDIGKEEFNLELSERRAHSVYQFIRNHGIAKQRLQFIGMGESVPLYPNNNDENRRRNRRVEFILLKKDK